MIEQYHTIPSRDNHLHTDTVQKVSTHTEQAFFSGVHPSDNMRAFQGPHRIIILEKY